MRQSILRYFLCLLVALLPALGMADNQAVPNIFATQSGNVPASQLDANFATVLDAGINRITATGTANTYTAVSNPAITAYVINQPFSITFPVSNTGASTINFNGVGSATIYKISAGSEVNISSGDIIANVPYVLVCDGTNFVVINPSNSSLVAGQLAGTVTNDNANAGNVGEYINSNVSYTSPTAISSNTPTNLASVSLTAGDWDVWGHACFYASSASSGWIAGINTTSAVMPAIGIASALNLTGGNATAVSPNLCINAPMQRVSIATTTPVYLVVQGSFSGSGGSYGFISARRRR